MSDSGSHESQSRRHGNIFSRHSGAMLVHVQRENGLAHRTMTLRPWQVQILRVVASRWFVGLVLLAVLSWGYFAAQTARVAYLTNRLVTLEADALRLDTLQRALTQLQQRYDQVQKMLSAQSGSPNVASGAPGGSPKAALTANATRKDSTSRPSGAKSRADSSTERATPRRIVTDSGSKAMRTSKGDSGLSKRMPKTDSGARKP